MAAMMGIVFEGDPRTMAPALDAVGTRSGAIEGIRSWRTDGGAAMLSSVGFAVVPASVADRFGAAAGRVGRLGSADCADAADAAALMAREAFRRIGADAPGIPAEPDETDILRLERGLRHAERVADAMRAVSPIPDDGDWEGLLDPMRRDLGECRRRMAAADRNAIRGLEFLAVVAVGADVAQMMLALQSPGTSPGIAALSIVSGMAFVVIGYFIVSRRHPGGD